MDLQKIVEQWLKANGYDGLYHFNDECACILKDLMPCNEPGIDCTAGYKCTCQATDYFRFMIGRKQCAKCKAADDIETAAAAAAAQLKKDGAALRASAAFSHSAVDDDDETPEP